MIQRAGEPGAVSAHAATTARRQASGRDVDRVRGEPAEVWLSDGRPVRFVWRGRLYTVLSIVERPPVRPEPDGGTPLIWLCWRVLASPGKNIPPAHYQLCHDTVRDRWLLSRGAAS